MPVTKRLKSLILYLMHSKHVVWPFSQTGIFLLLGILGQIGQRISSVNLFLMFSNSLMLIILLFSSNFSSRILICSFNLKFSFSSSLIQSMGTPAVLDPVYNNLILLLNMKIKKANILPIQKRFISEVAATLDILLESFIFFQKSEKWFKSYLKIILLKETNIYVICM